MPAKPTQRDRVLAFLRDAGGRGIHTHELRQAMIGNPSQRIAELEGLGHEIEHKRERRNDSPGTRYFLKSAGGRGTRHFHDADPVRDQTTPSGEGAQPPAVHDEPVSLFGDESQGQVEGSGSAYDPFSEAA
jgi:hypothetical protein